MPKRKWDSLETMTLEMASNMRRYEATGVKPWNARAALNDLAYQAGGLQKLIMQLNGERHLQGKSKKALLSDIEMELAEVVSISLFAAHELGLDVRKGFQRMLDSDKKKIKARRTR